MGMVSVLGVTLTRGHRFLGRGRTGSSRSIRRCLAALGATFVGGGLAGVSASPRTRLLAAAIVLIDGGPSTPLGFISTDAFVLVLVGDMISLPLLLVGVFRF